MDLLPFMLQPDLHQTYWDLYRLLSFIHGPGAHDSAANYTCPYIQKERQIRMDADYDAKVSKRC